MAGNPHLCILFLQDVKSESARVKPLQTLNIGVFNVHGCSTNEVKMGEIGKMFFCLDVCSKRD